jgi:hypothetical protein
LLCINQRKDIKTIILGQGKEILLFNTQRLDITTFAGRCFANLLQAPLNNAPSAPSKFLLSQSIDHLKGKGMDCMNEKELEREC